jgi:hypothetical protein
VAVGEEDSVGLEHEHVFGGCEGRNNGDFAAGMDEAHGGLAQQGEFPRSSAKMNYGEEALSGI